MTDIINTNDSLPVASEEECSLRRESLISRGVIRPSSCEKLKRKDGTIVISTKESSKTLRETLINKDIIGTSLVELPPCDRSGRRLEEGEYQLRPVTERNYLRKRSAYFRVMQEILKSRKELNLNLGKKNKNDPDWIF